MGFFSKISGLFSKNPRHARDFGNSSVLQEAPSGWALPPLSSDEAQEVLTQSEYAALEATPDGGEPLNPHPEGSRQHRLWAENFNEVHRAHRKKR